MASPDDLRAAIAATLHEHASVSWTGSTPECRCGWRSDGTVEGETFDQHRADAVLAAIAAHQVGSIKNGRLHATEPECDMDTCEPVYRLAGAAHQGTAPTESLPDPEATDPSAPASPLDPALAERLELWPSGFMLNGINGGNAAVECVRCDETNDAVDCADFTVAVDWVAEHRCPGPAG